MWEANIDQIDLPINRLSRSEWNVAHTNETPAILMDDADIQQSIISGGSMISGKVVHSVLSDSVAIGKGSKIVNSVIMPNVYIGDHVKIFNAVVGTNAMIMDGSEIGVTRGEDFFVDHQVCSRGVSLVAPWSHIAEGMWFQAGSNIYQERLEQFEESKNGRRHYEYTYSYELSV